MKNICFLLFALFFSFQLKAQTAADAIQYSRTELGGTARFVGVGGAFGALGADFSVLSSNPAGLAMYRTSEFVFTPSMQLHTSTANFGGASFSEEKNRFHIDNAGMVFYKRPRNRKWTTFNVGIGFNQLANFNQSIYYQGDAAGSIMNSFWADAASVGFDQNQFYPFGSQLAANTGAIYPGMDPTMNGGLSYDFADNQAAVISHEQSVDISGRMNEMVLSFAGNYDERIMVGATFGIPFIRYNRRSSYSEVDNQENVEFFDNLSYTDNLLTEGVGFNAKLGLIYRMNQMLRFGAAVHTPTFLSMTDQFSTDFSYTFTDGTGTNSAGPERSPDGVSDYRLRTPWKAIFSTAAILGKNGFLSADIEVVDYSNNRFNFTRDVNSTENAAFQQALNRQITQTYGQTVNMRFGGEATLDILRFRAGMAFFGQPNADATAFDRSFSTGIGIRGESAYADLGIRFNRGSETISPYVVTQNQINVETNVKSTDLVLTVGLKF